MRPAPVCAVALCALLGGCLSWHTGALPGEPADATFAELRGAHIRYTDEGTGPAVVLVHGYTASLATWDDVRPVLARDHRVVALDLKGFGWSDRPPGDYSPEEQAALVLALMNELGIERAALVGHSYGASVALRVALAAPERVTRLALYDAWVYEEQLLSFHHWSRGEPAGEALFGVFYGERPDEQAALALHDPERFLTEERMEAYEARLDRPGARAAALAVVRGMQYGHTQWEYRRVRQPVLLLWGREDRITPVTVGERLLADLPNAELRVFPRCGHFPMIEAQRPSTNALVAFLSSLHDEGEAK